MAILGFAGVAAGAYIVIQSIIVLSTIFHISEYFISFFAAAIGTSLPELAIDFNAIRKRKYDLAIGDIIGSSIVDASLSIGIGPLLFPSVISGDAAMLTGIYAIFASFIVVLMLALRGKVDKKAGVLFVTVYLFSCVLLVCG